VAKHRILALLIVIAAAGCTYSGGIDNPLIRKATWFSYVGGDDLRSRCGPGAPQQYRLIYNANWNEQVRAYDLKASATGDGSAMLFTQVFGGYGSDLMSFSITDPLAPARGTSGQARLSPPQFADLVTAINDSGFVTDKAPYGTRLESWDFYWVIAACVDGRFQYNAWVYPSERYNKLRFAAQLFALDGTGVSPNAPRDVNSAEEYSNSEFPRRRTYGGTPYTFELVVGNNGLASLF